MPADHSHHLTEHARHRHELTLDRARQTLAEMTDGGEPVNMALVARRAGVSRSWLYSQPELRDRIQQLQRLRTGSGAARDTVTRASDDSLRRRLVLAHERISQLREDNRQLREALAHAHGQLRAARFNPEGE